VASSTGSAWPEAGPSRTYVVRTLGCKANLYDSQRLEAELRARGWRPAPRGHEGSAGLCIVNSCTVTDEADRQSRKLAERLAREHAGARVIFTGCGAEVEPESAAAGTGVHYVVGNQDKGRLVELVLGAVESNAPAGVLGGVEGYGELLSRHPMDREWHAAESSFAGEPRLLDGGESARTRAFLKVQEGCDAFCTYCVIPYGRGPARSLTRETVVRQVAGLVAQGAREVVLTGTNLGDFGVERAGRPALEELVEAILEGTTLERLRLSSLDPTEISDRLLALAAREPRLCPHFHVSLQSPHGRILRLMKRRYGAEAVEERLRRIAGLGAQPVGGVFVGMDVITGFPGESEDEFEWTRERLAALPWTRLHVFPYSERKGTPATRLPGSVPPAERARRAKVLRELSLERLRAHHHDVLATLRKRNERVRDVLIEGRTKGPDGQPGWWIGYSANYLRVMMKPGDAAARPNALVEAWPTQVALDAAAGDACLF
jgi:threonylcarbamoyladenosine tRNA methylthiotransferase MtaB